MKECSAAILLLSDPALAAFVLLLSSALVAGADNLAVLSGGLGVLNPIKRGAGERLDAEHKDFSPCATSS